MDKWFSLALNSFIGIIVLNLLFGILFGGHLGVVSLTSLFILGVKILYILMIVGLIIGIFAALKEFIFNE